MRKSPCMFPATARPQASALLRTWLCRSAKSPRSDHMLEIRELPRGQRVLDGLSGVRAKGWLEACNRRHRIPVSVEILACANVAFDSVKHTTSPSRRDYARRVISSHVSQIQPAATEHRPCPALRRRVPQSVLVTPFACPAFPSLLVVGWCASLLFEAREEIERHAGEIQTQNNRPHIAMSCQPSFAWKASLTRTPPPICTSAPGSKTALVLRAVGAAND